MLLSAIHILNFVNKWTKCIKSACLCANTAFVDIPGLWLLAHRYEGPGKSLSAVRAGNYCHIVYQPSNYTIYLESVLMLSYHLCLDHPNDLFSWGFPMNISYACPVSSCILHAPPSFPSRFNHSERHKQGVQTIMLLIM
jgi:hypothetical protein